MRKLLTASLLAVAVGCGLGCSGSATVVEVTFAPGTSPPTGIVSIDLSMSLGGRQAMTTFSKGGNAEITLPTTAALQIGSGLTGMMTINATARNAAGAVLATGAGTVNVNSGQVNEVTIRFGGVIVDNDLGGEPGDMATTPAQIVIDKMMNDFGSVITGQSSAPATFTITNSGGSTTGTLTAMVTGTNASQFTIGANTCAGATLAGGASCTVQVTYAPAAPGVASATLTVSGTPGGTVTSSLSGMGLAPGTLSVMPMSKDFLPVLVNQSSANQTFTITNTGAAATGVPTVMLTGTDAAHFNIVTNNCTAAIGPSLNCTIIVKFAPTTAGAKSAALTVTASPGGAVSPGLTGTALTPASLAFDMTSKGYGTVNVGSMTAATTFTLSNGGTQTTSTVSTSFTGNTGDFVVTDNCNTKTLGAACTVAIVFKPTSFGPKSATFTATAATGGMATVMVSGTGQDTVNLTVNIVGTGTVTGGGINCTNANTPCTAAVTRNGATAPTVTLMETPGSGQAFSAWTVDCTGTGQTCDVLMSGNKTVTATFVGAGVQPVLWWKLDGNGTNSGTTANYPLGLNGSITYVTGKFGQAAQFNAGAYGIVTGSLKAVLASASKVTIGYWINASAAPNTGNSFFDFWQRTTAPYGGIQHYYTSATQYGLCVASLSNTRLPAGGCNTFNAPAANQWHHIILRYNGSGTAAGQGAPLEVYIDDVLTFTVNQDGANDPVFSNGMSDTLYIGTSGLTFDDVKIYTQVFTPAQQCTTVIGGTWSGTSCTLP